MNYCTLFNSKYLARGTAMIESLLKQDSSAKIMVVSMDSQTTDFLKKKFSSRIDVVALEKIETEEYLKLKPRRGFGEYCWTLTARILDYALNDLKLDHSIYVDADCYFLADPSVKTKEWTKNFDVMITPHNYAAKYDQSETSGVFCVQYVFIKNTDRGLTVLEEWRKQCVDWCFARHEDGKFGDQKYLDQWPMKPGVLICPEIGFGVAPWNISRLRLEQKTEKDQNILIYKDTYSSETAPVTFYHFHDFKLYDFQSLNVVMGDLSSYRIGSKAKEWIYKPYLKKLNFVKKELPNPSENDWLQYPNLKTMARWSKRLLSMGDWNLLW